MYLISCIYDAVTPLMSGKKVIPSLTKQIYRIFATKCYKTSWKLIIVSSIIRQALYERKSGLEQYPFYTQQLMLFLAPVGLLFTSIFFFCLQVCSPGEVGHGGGEGGWRGGMDGCSTAEATRTRSSTVSGTPPRSTSTAVVAATQAATSNPSPTRQAPRASSEDFPVDEKVRQGVSLGGVGVGRDAVDKENEESGRREICKGSRGKEGGRDGRTEGESEQRREAWG